MKIADDDKMVLNALRALWAIVVAWAVTMGIALLMAGVSSCASPRRYQPDDLYMSVGKAYHMGLLNACDNIAAILVVIGCTLVIFANGGSEESGKAMKNPHNFSGMILHFVRDPYSYIAAAGVTLMSSIDWIVRHVSPVIGLLAGLGGLVMLVLSIIEKVKKNRNLDAEYREISRRSHEE